MYAIRKEEELEYNMFLTKIACIIHEESQKNLKDLSNGGELTLERIRETYLDVGAAMGQIALDKVIEETKNMPQDKIIRFLTELSCSINIRTMRENPSLVQKIDLMVKLKNSLK